MKTNNSIKRAYFVGIAGVGMSATAVLLKEQGWMVSGSDEGCHPPISDYLDSQGIEVHKEYKGDNFPENTDLVVAGGSAKLKPGDNPELQRASDLNIPVKTFPEVIGELSEKRHSIVVVGSYGKSTVTALIAWCLVHAGKDPSYFIGAIPLQMKSHGHLGDGDIFVIEGDEYPTSGIDKHSKFMHFFPTDIVLISAELDHVNIFPTKNDYVMPYAELLSKPTEGIIMACIDNPNVEELIASHKDRTITYSINKTKNPDWLGVIISRGAITKFNLMHEGKKVCELETNLLGDHNVQNIVGAVSLLLEKEMLTINEVSKAVKDFSGIKRRLDLMTENSSVLVYEGFGSSYDKALSAINAMKAHFPDKRLVIVFEPHAFSWRNRNMLHWYDNVFESVDKVFIYHPPSINATSHDQVTHEEIINQVKKAGIDVTPISAVGEGEKLIREELNENDAVLILTSGDMDGLVGIIPEIANKFFPKK